MPGVVELSDRWLTAVGQALNVEAAGRFAAVGPLIVGLADVGRATVRLLNVNAPRRVELRSFSPP